MTQPKSQTLKRAAGKSREEPRAPLTWHLQAFAARAPGNLKLPTRHPTSHESRAPNHHSCCASLCFSLTTTSSQESLTAADRSSARVAGTPLAAAEQMECEPRCRGTGGCHRPAPQSSASCYQLGAKCRKDFGERQHFKVFTGKSICSFKKRKLRTVRQGCSALLKSVSKAPAPSCCCPGFLSCKDFDLSFRQIIPLL